MLFIGFGGLIMLVSGLALGAEQAADTYRTYCVQCHGLQGNGKGLNVRDMSVQPRDHTDAKEMATRSDEDLFKVIKEGGVAVNKSVLMPPWGGVISDEEIRGLVVYLRQLCKCSYGR
ncbi:MAG: cytochrome c [Gammaproteobacteria bacterium]|nr:cytochrome c [Gammaproteobacteria bacterium]